MSKHNNNNKQNNNNNVTEEEEVVDELTLEDKEETTEKVKVNVNIEPPVEEKKEEVKEEKKPDIANLKPDNKKASRVEEIDKEIEDLMRQLDKCFSPVKQVTLDEQIKLLKQEKKSLLQKKMEVGSVKLGGETVKDANITNDVIPAGRGIVVDTRSTTSISIS